MKNVSKVNNLSEIIKYECTTALSDNYKLSLYITAIFIIMIVSFLGTALPVIGKKFQESNYDYFHDYML